MTTTVAADEAQQPGLTVAGKRVPLIPVGAFLDADSRRPTSFVTNFGDWQLPADAAAVFGSPVVHLEWFYDTGELVAFGQIPHLGHGDIEVSGAQAAVDTLAGPFGGAGGRVVHAADGAVREFFPAMVVGPDTLVAILATISHGPRVHEKLWGWHLHHRNPDGWTWLLDRVATAGT